MKQSLAEIARLFANHAPGVDDWTLRLVQDHQEDITVRQGVLQPLTVACRERSAGLLKYYHRGAA